MFIYLHQAEDAIFDLYITYNKLNKLSTLGKKILIANINKNKFQIILKWIGTSIKGHL